MQKKHLARYNIHLIKTLIKIGIEVPQHIKAIYDKQLISYSIMKNGKFFSKFKNKTRMTILITIIQHSTASPSQSNQTRERHKRPSNWEWRSKIVAFHRWHDIYRKPERVHQKSFRNNKSRGKFAGHKTNVQKSDAFLYTSNIRKKPNSFAIATNRIK